jgi:hypothetical protein
MLGYGWGVRGVACSSAVGINTTPALEIFQVVQERYQGNFPY